MEEAFLQLENLNRNPSEFDASAHCLVFSLLFFFFFSSLSYEARNIF